MIKRKLALLIPVVAAVALYGCSDETKNTSMDKETEETEKTEQRAPMQTKDTSNESTNEETEIGVDDESIDYKRTEKEIKATVDASAASIKNTPTSGYFMTLHKEKTILYSKPNSKKKVYTIKRFIYENGEGNIPTAQSVNVKRIYKNGWSKVSYKTKKKTYIGYIKTSGLRINLHSLDRVFVDNPKGGNLKNSPNKNSKTIAKVPLGAVMDIYYNSESTTEPYILDKYGEYTWMKVAFYKNEKRYIGWLSHKAFRSF